MPFTSFLPAVLAPLALVALAALAVLLAFETGFPPRANAHDGELGLATGRGATTRLRLRELCGGPLALMLAGLGTPLLWPEPEAGVALLATATALHLLRGPATAHAAPHSPAQQADNPQAPHISYAPVAHMRTPFTTVRGMPIQPVGAQGVAGSIDVLPEFAEGLADIEGFSHLLVIYHLHECKGFTLRVKPFLDNDEHGVFATRSPRRPNPIGISVLRLTGVTGNRLHVENVDMLDGTPVLDIKPYVPTFDVWDADRTGWFATVADNAVQCRADDRFVPADTTQPQTGGAS
ncbi:tRNA (N6-threonylcarbamoyladenosine(37)-N6)-methyltransferase TrmO [Desulfovibrio oxamicus]|uniref:tRNA (N6-threonylcarbamoyladenosine(37)-N6)-methyltransferase TrmO n=1 Tax=Nitratidesulfovibrio oxamicus TaxID=32016 RepID=A0ABS0J2A4_9BACT|nr:tRNA (N6-threonylcarbamoyladenosine(37)-N6)-methyltransferase TrmO [Nitratidesulfovibrio oxamicus]MBG3876563.1 tRNA (N6-threonylcarbamoyladenosine(37)-N6)-methyltransferase TrmO [Nitratidesulfovibrio oxamicus]